MSPNYFLRTLAVDLRIEGGGSPFSLKKHRGCPKGRVVVSSVSVKTMDGQKKINKRLNKT